MSTLQLQYSWRERVVLTLVTIFAVVGLIAGSLAVSTGVAQAGSNGQQLLAAHGCSNPAKITWIRVTGKNQNNQRAVWEAWPNDHSVLTKNWWWKGDVYIEWRNNRDPYHHSTLFKVRTKVEGRDYDVTFLDKWGC